MPFATPPLDLEIFNFLNHTLRTPALDTAMPLISSPLVMWGLGVLALVPLILKERKRAMLCFLVILAAAGLSDYSTKLLKKEFGRIRPLNILVDTNYKEDGEWRTLSPERVQPDKHGSSYPSAHSSTSMAAAILAMLFWPGSRPWMLLLPLLVGWSRVYLGKHYPTDVLAGWMWGMVVSGTVWILLNTLEKKMNRPGFLTRSA